MAQVLLHINDVELVLSRLYDVLNVRGHLLIVDFIFYFGTVTTVGLKEGDPLIMNYTFLGKNDSIVYIESEDILISDPQSALDLMMTVKYEKDCSRIILDKKVICEEFFRLRSGIAGEVIQKFVNYNTKLAVIGDFSKYTSKPLQDFIYECNKGKDIFFVDNLDQAVEKLNLYDNAKEDYIR